MAGLLDLLAGAFQAQDPNSQSAPVPPATTDSSGNTTVAPVNITASPRKPPIPPSTSQGVTQSPTGATQNYDNSGDVQALHQWVQNNQPQGGSDNPGVFGLLPPGAQHGTLRNVLGAIGDAFLLQGDKQPMYAQRMARQQIGDAMAGYETNPQAAIERVAATGAMGAPEMADKMEQNYQNLKLHQDQLQQMQIYRNQQLDVRNQNIFARLGPMAQGMVSAAKDQPDYAKRYSVLDQRAKAIDPNSSAAEAFGIPEPDDWSATPGYGMTSNQQAVDQAKAAQRTTSERDTDVNARSRVTAANIGANSHIQAATIGADRTTDASILQGLIQKQNSGQQLTPSEQQTFAHLTQVNGRNRRGLPGSGQTVTPGNYGGVSVAYAGANNPVANSGKAVTPAQARSLPQGTHYRTTDGRWIVR